jgi:uncharacterized protein YfaS (alpha-2-macroglobulin family)
MTTTRTFWLSSAAVFLAVASAVTVKSFQDSDANSTAHISATYVHSVLRTVIPFHSLHAGSGLLTIQVLSPEDEVLARSERRIDVPSGTGSWRDDLKLDKPLPTDELVWHRLRYRFTYDQKETTAIQGVESISEVLRIPSLNIIGQQTWMSGAPIAVRAIVSDSQGEPIPGPGTVAITLKTPDGKSVPLYTGKLNARGTVEASFRAPAALVGTFPVQYSAETPLGSVDYTQQVHLEDQISTLLNTEKPLYQPGQTIHVRALALNRASHEAVAARKLTFELEDSRGNKIFRQATQTSNFGVASAEFALADEVNLGTWHLRALLDGAGAQHAELALNVDHYVLPKFKVALDFANSDQKTKRGYRPGDHVTGTVRANYFFGKPVDNSTITVAATAPGLGGEISDLVSVKGTTDSDGAYRFDLRLPDYFAGRPLDHGAARVLIEARVKDNAAHSETHGEPITVSESPLLLTAVPESGALIQHLENRIFILASYPDGTPATADLTVELPGNPVQTTATDSSGVAIVQFTDRQESTLQIKAADKEGNHTSTSIRLDTRVGDDQILLRTERAIYKVGDRMQLKVFSTRQRGAAYIDIVKDGQTILTRDMDLTNGAAELTVPVTAAMSGTLDCDAYLFGANAKPVADHRLVFVQPADELRIETTADAAQYQPGAEARVRFKVTNSRGEGVQAALGVQAVDEAVFALAEKQPGFAKVFFYLEQEAMKPRYEIHSFGMPDVVQPIQTEQHDRAAQALFSATEMTNSNRFQTKAGGTVPVTALAVYRDRYQARFIEQVVALAKVLNREYAKNPAEQDLGQIAARLAASGAPEMRDLWDHELIMQPVTWLPGRKLFMVRSVGSTKLGMQSGYIELKSGEVGRNYGAGGQPTNGFANVEHNRGPVTQFAEVTGTVVDLVSNAVSKAVVTLTNTDTKAVHTLSTDATGQFTFSGIVPGTYDVRVSATGFKTETFTAFKLVARDRAVIQALLQIGSVSESVSVTAAVGPAMVVTGSVGFGEGGGFGGGGRGFGMAGAGGVLGGLPMNAPPAPMQLNGAAINGRDLFGYMKLVPGVISPVTNAPSAAPAPHTRSWFPEALYINPEIITDATGSASITISIADSITTWRMAMLASTTHGSLGTGSASIKVFQDFFTDLDLPVTLTQGDRVELPVAIYNYTGNSGDVKLQLKPDDWYSLVDDSADKSIAVDSGRVGAAHFTLEAKRIGKFSLTLSSHIAGAPNHADIVVREIEVVPNGREQNIVFNGQLETSVAHQIDLPADAIPDASKLFVRLYPGPLSQVVEGMDAILRMPGGCFEQTSSSTYPNILALDYMKRTKKLTPEVHAKAEGFIASGYQRLLTFEVPGGGFSWFGQAPANKILTAYGLMEFYDMSQVHDVDANVIRRTQAWLASQQQPDGSWKPDTQFINEGATNRFNSGALRITAYIAWALENTGYKGTAVEKARSWVQEHMSDASDSYTKAVIANFAADYPDRETARTFAAHAADALLAAKTTKDDNIWWTAEETGVYGRGDSAAIETTGLAVQALLKWGEAASDTRKALHYISAKKDATGAWGTTQATIMALRALLLASSKGGADASGTVEITIDGAPVQHLMLTADNNDLFHQFVFSAKPSSAVGIQFTGKGGLAYQVATRYFVPWSSRGEDPATHETTRSEPLSIDVTYNRERLAQDDIATATATVRNNLPEAANMVMIDLGIPPGFDLLTEDLQDYVEKTATKHGGRLEKFSLTATQAILYFDSINARATVSIPFRLRAKYPIRARTFQSRVYEYYQPEINAVAKPIQLEIVAKNK